MTSSGLLPVFANTSLDTHLAIAVSSDDTVASFKRKFVTEHGLCFPEVGRINIEALMTRWQGKEYHLSETLPISAVLQIKGGCFLEALVVTQVRPDTDNQLFAGPLHHPTEAAARAINSSMKKKRKRNASFEDTTLRPTESMKRGEEEFEGRHIQEEPGHGQNRQSNDSYCDANSGEAKKGESRKAERTDIKAGGWGEYPDESRRQKKANVLQMPANDASIAVHVPEYIKEAPPCLEKAKDIFGKNSRHDSESPEIPGPTKEKAKNDDAKKKVRKDDIKKDRSLLEVTQTTGTVLPGVTTGKRKKRRTKGPCSDLPSEVAPIIKHEPQVEDRNQVSQKEKDFNLAEKPGDTWSGSHEGGNTKKKEGEKDTSKLSSCHEYNPTCKNHTYNVIIAAEEAAITEMAAELKGSSCSSNVLLCKELVLPCKKNLLVLDINGLLADITSDCKYQQYEDFKISGKLDGSKKKKVDLTPPLPSRHSSRLQNVAPVNYTEARGKKSHDLANSDVVLIEECGREELYTEEHEKLLGSCEAPWTLFVDGYDKDSKRIYDPVKGKTCHQCRQKTMGYCTSCCKCQLVQGQFCGDCLYMRYGENVLEAIKNPDWICPVCRGICNCSLCRLKKGWNPTGTLYKKAVNLGYKSVAHYLIETRRKPANSGEAPSSEIKVAMSNSTEAAKENEAKSEIISEKTGENIIVVKRDKGEGHCGTYESSAINDGETMGKRRHHVKRKKGEGHTGNLSPGPIASRLRRRIYGV